MGFDIFSTGDENYGIQFEDVNIGEIYFQDKKSNILGFENKYFEFDTTLQEVWDNLKSTGEKLGCEIINVINNPDFQIGFGITLSLIGLTTISPAMANDGKPEKKVRSWEDWKRDVFNYNIIVNMKDIFRNPQKLMTRENAKKMLYVSAGVTTAVSLVFAYKKLEDSGYLGYYWYRMKTFCGLAETLQEIKFKKEMQRLLKHILEVEKLYQLDKAANNFPQKYGNPQPVPPSEIISDLMKSQLIKDVFLQEFVKTQNQKK
jgi:hypothetical protein